MSADAAPIAADETGGHRVIEVRGRGDQFAIFLGVYPRQSAWHRRTSAFPREFRLPPMKQGGIG